MNQLAVIHIAKKDLGLDDDNYRDLLVGVTGRTSSRDMTASERGRVIDEMRRLGWKDKKNADGGSSPRHKRLEGKFARKLQALWLSAWHLGIVRDRTDAALCAFVQRQTGIEHTRFLHYDDDAKKVIEALKKWLEREGGVVWRASNSAPPWTQGDAARIAIALVRKADAMGLFTLPLAITSRIETVADMPIDAFRSKDWVRVHQHFGARIRKALAEKNEGGE